MVKPFPEGMEKALFGMGCFWGAERIFSQMPDVYSTAVGYAGGVTSHPTYEEVCSGRTGHVEVVFMVFDPKLMEFDFLLKAFWEGHDPTQGMRQGNDFGTQYRSVIYCFSDVQRCMAETTRRTYGELMREAGFGLITTEIVQAPQFFYAEEHHQQYLVKNSGGYCGLGGTGVVCSGSVEDE